MFPVPKSSIGAGWLGLFEVSPPGFEGSWSSDAGSSVREAVAHPKAKLVRTRIARKFRCIDMIDLLTVVRGELA